MQHSSLVSNLLQHQLVHQRQFIREKGMVENVVYTINIESLLQSSYEGNPKKVKYHLRLFLATAEAKHKGLGMKICKGILRYMGFIVVVFGCGCCCWSDRTVGGVFYFSSIWPGMSSLFIFLFWHYWIFSACIDEKYVIFLVIFITN